jgi:HK97 family phage portal protein
MKGGDNLGWLLDKLRRKPPKNSTYADMLNGFTPIYSQFGTDIYASDVVQQAVNCIVSELKKLNPQHIRKNGLDVLPVNSSIQKVLNAPNELMTTSDFLEKVVWLLFLNYNAFIIPTYKVWENEKGIEERYYTGLYPIKPIQVDFIQDASDTLFVKFTFENNYETTLQYSDVIHIRYRYSVNEFMGGNENGQPDNEALLKTLDLNYQLLHNLSKAMSSSCAVNGVVKFKSLIDKGKTEAAMKELEEKLKNSESGFLPIDLSSEFIPIQRDIQFVDEATLKFIDEKILRHFGVPLAILTGDFTAEQMSAFYQKTLEPIIISMSQAFTKTLFTQREISFGNKVQFYPKELIFMSISQTLEMARIMGDRGSIYENELRCAFGLPPLPELVGKRMQSLNYVDVEYAKQYQTGNGGSETE